MLNLSGCESQYPKAKNAHQAVPSALLRVWPSRSPSQCCCFSGRAGLRLRVPGWSGRGRPRAVCQSQERRLRLAGGERAAGREEGPRGAVAGLWGSHGVATAGAV